MRFVGASIVSPASALFLFTELACYFLFSIWWRGQVPLWLGVGIGFAHLVGLVLMLRQWERWRGAVDLGLPDPGIASPLRPPVLPIAVLLSAGLLVQAFFFSDPVLSGPDEPVMISDHSSQVSSLLAPGPLPAIGLALACVMLWIAATRMIRPLARKGGPRQALAGAWPWILLLLAGMVVFGFAESVSRINWGLAERWPPFGTVLLLPLHLLGIDNIVALRLISALYYVSAGGLVYRIVRIEAGQVTGLAAATLALAAPAFFNWGHYAFREMGGVFFFCLGIACLQQVIRMRRAEDIGLLCAVAALGYLQRRPSVLMVVVAGITLLLVFHRRLFAWRNLRALALPALAMVWVALPWIAISSNVRVYVLYTDHLLQPDMLLSYLRALPGQAGWPLVLLAVAGLAIGIVRRRWMAFVAAVWLLLLNLLFVMDVTAPRVIDRFAIHFIPGLAILSGFALGALRNRRAAVYAAVAVSVMGLVTLATWLHDDDRELALLPGDGLRYATEPLYPYDAVADWLGSRVRELPAGQRLLLFQPVPWQSALPLYLERAGNHRARLVEAPRRGYRPNRDFDTALAACRAAGCDWLVVPVNRAGRLILHPGFTLSMLETRGLPGIERFDGRHGSVLLVPPPPVESGEEGEDAISRPGTRRAGTPESG